VRWRDRTGVFHRDLGDNEHAEIVIADRTFRVRIADLLAQNRSTDALRRLALVRRPPATAQLPPVLDWKEWLVCSQCGSREIDREMDSNFRFLVRWEA
jgi:hypothetical protein